MPTVARIGGYRFYFFSHEPNEPPHIHVEREDQSAKFWLERLALARNHGFNATELRVIHRLVKDRRGDFLEAWYDYFGAPRR